MDKTTTTPPAAPTVPTALPDRCGFVAIIGPTNAGKSTLVNTLVGSKVTIVSHKVQTTRVPVRGIAIEGRSQLVFIDTPGIFNPKRRLDRAMVSAAWGGIADADAVVLLVDAARGFSEDVEAILERLSTWAGCRVLVLNKIDRVEEKEKLLKLAAALNERISFDRVFMITATGGKGVVDFRRYLAGVMPAGPWHYPEDDISDTPLRVLAGEITREKVYEYLHQELPYDIMVETTEWKDLKGGAARIEQTIYVTRESQKKIVLGEGGSTIKRISSESRAELAKMIERPVHLFLFVKVRENWESDPERYRSIGLDFPKD
jgi:GTPase